MHINLNKIIWDSFKDNKAIFFSVATLLGGLFLEELLFPKMYSEFVIGLSDKQKMFNVKIILILLGICAFALILFYISDKLEEYSLPNIEMDIIKRITLQVMESVKTEKTQFNASELALNMKKVNEIQALIPIFNRHIAPTILISIGVTIYFLYYSTELGLVTLLLLLITIFVLFKLSGSCLENVVNDEKKMDAIIDRVNDMLGNVNSVIASNMENKEINKVSEMIEKIEKFNKNTSENGSCITNNTILSAIYFGILFILNGFAVKLYSDNKINLASLMSIFFIVLILVQYYESLKHEIKYIMHYVGMYHEALEYFAKFKINNTKLREDFKVDNGKIQFNNVNLTYGDKNIFNNFNLNILNKHNGIIGKIGSGKTSLLKLLVDMQPYEGDIVIDGQNLKDFSYESKMKCIAYIPQNPKLFNRSIYENLSYGTNYSFEQIQNWIGKIGFGGFFKSFDDGLNTIVGHGGEKVSTGQRHIISILRAIIQDKKIILFDEPTASLDNYHKKIFINLVNFMKDKTILIVTHDNILHIFDEVIQLTKDVHTVAETVHLKQIKPVKVTCEIGEDK